VVVAIIAGALGLTSLVRNFQGGAFSCLPSDFPSYPAATVSSEHTYVGTGLPPGDTKQCSMVLESSDDVSTVTDYYSSHLSSGGWTATVDPASGVISFQSTTRTATRGTIELLGRGEHTEIRITLDS
jgi:hypothetical protein